MSGYIRTNRILSALPDNCVDYNKVSRYADEMKQNDMFYGHCGFPPITGYPDIVTSDDIGSYFYLDSDTEEVITDVHLGIDIFRVTDGHHRWLAACNAGIYGLEWEKDESGFVYVA